MSILSWEGAARHLVQGTPSAVREGMDGEVYLGIPTCSLALARWMVPAQCRCSPVAKQGWGSPLTHSLPQLTWQVCSSRWSRASCLPVHPLTSLLTFVSTQAGGQLGWAASLVPWCTGRRAALWHPGSCAFLNLPPPHSTILLPKAVCSQCSFIKVCTGHVYPCVHQMCRHSPPVQMFVKENCRYTAQLVTVCSCFARRNPLSGTSALGLKYACVASWN